MKYRVISWTAGAHGRSRIKPEYAESEFTTTDMARDAQRFWISFISDPVFFLDSAMEQISPWNSHPCFRNELGRDCHQWKCLTGWADSSCPGFLCGEILLSESGDKSVPGNLRKKSCRGPHPFMSFPSSAARFPALQFSHDVPGAA